MRGILTSTVARIVAAIFLLQIASGGLAIWLLHSQMAQVIADDRTRQIFDLRDDLLSAYYEGGPEGLSRYVAEQRGSTADPLIFVGVAGDGPPLLNHLAAFPSLPVTRAPVAVQLRVPGLADPAGGVAVSTQLPDGSRLVVGALTTPDRRFDLAFAEAIGLALITTVALAFAGALLLGYVISRRTHAIAATAEALGAGNFAARIPNAERGDGFDHLRRQINFMAERIDRLVGELQSVAGGLAHDLRSPVARLKASIDTALRSVPPEGTASEALHLARTDAEALEAMLGAALELAKLESGAVGDRRQRLDLAALATDLAELYEPLAEQSGVILSCEAAPLRVLADRELVSRALANLIDNAIKYGGDRVCIGLRREAGEAVIEVSDNGPGIAGADRERAIGRFTRLDNARTRPGAGLGLALVDAVARLHGGRLELDGADRSGGDGGGLSARLRLPLG